MAASSPTIGEGDIATVVVAAPEADNATSEGSDSDSNFVDSDYEVEDGDDDLFADNIDREVNDHNEAEEVVEHESDEALDDIDLNMREED